MSRHVRLVPRARRAPEAGGETVSQWFGRLHAAKEAKGLATVKEMRGRRDKSILPGIEHKAMAKVTREDVEAIVRRLDAAVARVPEARARGGKARPSTAANVWGDLSHAFDEAVRAKDPSLRVLSVNPAATCAARTPEPTARADPLLGRDSWPCYVARRESDGKRRLDVPLYRRHVYAMAVYTKARSSELEALTAADVDLARGTMTIARQADRTSKGRTETKATKTKRTRTVDIEPNLAPLVAWLVKHPEGKRGRLLRMPPPEDRAELLRKDLRTVGVNREALHIERDPLRRAIVLHDLRDTGLTMMAVRGDSPIAIEWAAGHTDMKTTSGYIDRGRVEARRIGAPLSPLPPELLPEGPIEGVTGSADLRFEQTAEANTRLTRVFWGPQWELKSRSRGPKTSKAAPRSPEKQAASSPGDAPSVRPFRTSSDQSRRRTKSGSSA